MYVVIEHGPDGEMVLMDSGDWHDQTAEAVERAQELAAKARANGRAETYAVHEVDENAVWAA